MTWERVIPVHDTIVEEYILVFEQNFSSVQFISQDPHWASEIKIHQQRKMVFTINQEEFEIKRKFQRKS